MKRATRALVPLLAAGIVAVATPVLLGATAASGCEAIGRVQTYEGWGPALHYGETVTVAYAAETCAADAENGTFSFALEGSATLFAGTRASGTPIDVRTFEAQGSWSDPENAGWPPPWWSCGVESGSLRWEIPGAYSFLVSVTEGTWTLDVSPGDVHWAHDAC